MVENRAGGAGVIGTDSVAKSPPDGYTLLMGNHAVLAMYPHMAKNLPYDPLKSFAPVILQVTVPNILVVHPSIPANTLAELIAYAKANPGKLSYASQGTGASGHIAAELLKLHAGIDIVHVPYKGAAPAAQDLAAGHVSMMFDVVSLALPQIKAGRVRALGVAAKQRVAVLPEVPTLTEQGFPAEVGGWFGVLAPGRNATGGHRMAQSRDHQGVFGARHPRPLRAARRCRAARHAGDIRQVHRGRIRPLWRHHPARRDQAGIAHA